MMATDVFSCEYDAPMYVDFASMNERMDDDKADAWFDAAAAKETNGDCLLDDMFVGGGIGDEEEVDDLPSATENDIIENLPTLTSHEQASTENPSPGRKSHAMVLRPTSSTSSSSSNSNLSQPPRRPASAPRKPKLTVPGTPEFVRRGRQRLLPSNNHPAKSSEDLEMERITKLRADRRKVMKASQESYRQLQSTTGSACASIPRRAAVAPTIPVGFNFRTESRLAKHGPARPAEGARGESPGVFARKLRSYNNPAGQGKGQGKAMQQPTTTQPKPFKFQPTQSRAAHSDKENAALASSRPGTAAAKYVSAAEHLKKFQSATPDRFRTLPRSELNKGPIQARNPIKATPRVTVPITPKLSSQARSRPVTAESQAVKQEKEMEEIKAHQFKAKKFDPRIVSENGSYGLPKRTTPKTTVPVPLRLQTSKRCEERTTKDCHGSTPVKPFRAQPIPEEMFEHALGVPERAPANVTDAKTPNIRKCKRKAEDIVEAQAKRVAHENAEPHGLTPPRNTVLQPFDLQTDARGAVKVEQWKQKLAAEEEASRKAKQFHARPATAVHEEPFVPEPSHRGPTVPDDVRLNSDVRAEKRQEFDAMLVERELENAEEQYRRKLENEDREREERDRLRAAMVHKAQPVRHYKPVEVKPSERPLTKPTSPSFSDRITVKYQRGRTPQ